MRSFLKKQYLRSFSRPLGPGRENLGINFSKDRGKIWSSPVLLYKGPANYSDIEVLLDHSVMVLYGRGRPRYGTVTRFTLEEISNNKLKAGKRRREVPLTCSSVSRQLKIE